MFSSEFDQHLKVKSTITIYIQVVNYFAVPCSANDKEDRFKLLSRLCPPLNNLLSSRT